VARSEAQRALARLVELRGAGLSGADRFDDAPDLLMELFTDARDLAQVAMELPAECARYLAGREGHGVPDVGTYDTMVYFALGEGKLAKGVFLDAVFADLGADGVRHVFEFAAVRSNRAVMARACAGEQFVPLVRELAARDGSFTSALATTPELFAVAREEFVKAFGRAGFADAFEGFLLVAPQAACEAFPERVADLLAADPGRFVRFGWAREFDGRLVESARTRDPEAFRRWVMAGSWKADVAEAEQVLAQLTAAERAAAERVPSGRAAAVRGGMSAGPTGF
jgi:hypothetical protein